MSIDWTKPLYDNHGNKFSALYGSNRIPFKKDGCILVIRDGSSEPEWSLASGYIPTRQVTLSNEFPTLDWSSVVTAYSDEKDAVFKGKFVRIRYGLRNGKPFAEVAE